MGSKSKQLRSGYTTGACAAAAAKAAAIVLLRDKKEIDHVTIPLPGGSRVQFKVRSSEFGFKDSKPFAKASVIKDAGDDPDVTHGAEIVADVRVADKPAIVIKGGNGVGTVTKPGLAVSVGEPAINPVPRKMIREAVQEAILECGMHRGFEVTISVPAGEELAGKTLNSRLGILGGISILGTTGIVRPLSTEAYTASIAAGMDVAKAMGHSVVVLSSGRTSEKAHMKKYAFPEEAYVMMGDYLEFTLLEAKKHGFTAVHLCAQWAKMIKTAMSTPQTHVRHGAIAGKAAAEFLRSRGIDIPAKEYNTAREVFDHLQSSIRKDPSPPQPLLLKGRDKAGDAAALARSAMRVVCLSAKEYAERIAGIPVAVSLVSYEGEIIADSE